MGVSYNLRGKYNIKYCLPLGRLDNDSENFSL